MENKLLTTAVPTRSAFMDALLAKNSRTGMAQRNKVWLHQRRRKEVECQSNYEFLLCLKLGVGEIALKVIATYSSYIGYCL